MNVNILTNEASFQIFRHFLYDAEYLCDGIDYFENDAFSIQLVKIPNPNNYVITIYHKITMSYCIIEAIEGSKEEVISEFKRIVKLYKNKKN